MDNSLSYWEDTIKRKKSYRDQHFPPEVDCAIVGGGFTGLSAALHLARHGLSVAVLEREHFGWGASGRNGGMISPGIKTKIGVLIKRHGLEATRRMFDASVEAIELVKSLIEEEEIKCDLQETGSFYAAYQPGHYKMLEKYHHTLAQLFDHPTELIPPERTREEVGTDLYYGGLVNEGSMGLHPAKYVAGLVRAAEKAGVHLHEGASVQTIRPARGGGGFDVFTSTQGLSAKEVVIATNGYTDDLTPSLRRHVLPLGSFIIVTEPLNKRLADKIIPRRRMLFDSKNLLYYFRILPDKRMMFGGRVSFRPTTTERTGAILRKGMVRMFPDLEDVRVEYSWGGNLGLSFDLMPHSGKLDGLHYAMGYSGRGVGMATYLGKSLAATIAGKGGPSPFSETHLPSMILYRKRPWFMPVVGEYFRLRDELGRMNLLRFGDGLGKRVKPIPFRDELAKKVDSFRNRKKEDK